MGSVNLYMKFDYTDSDGNLYTDGSTTTAKSISISNNEIFDRTYLIPGTNTTATTILSDTLLDDFAFLWIESDTAGEIQLMCNEDGDFDDSPTPGHEVAFVLKLDAGIPFVIPNDDSRNMANVNGTFNQTNYDAEIDTWYDNWDADVIDRIQFYHQTSTNAKVRVFAVR